MAFTFKLPSVGENVEQADVGNLRVAVGDVISAQQVVMEIETDKAVFELPCPQAGRVTEILVKPGTTVSVGTPLLTLEPVGAGAPAAPAAAPAPAAPPAAPPKPAPAAVAPPVPVAPAPVAPAPVAPAPAQAPAQAPTPAVAPAPAAPAPAAAESSTVPPAPAAPATRRLARELGVDLHKVTGTGPGKRITQDDVQGYVRAALKQSPPPSAAPVAGAMVAPPLPDFSQFGPIERQPLNKIMRTGATNLSLAWNIIPHVTQHELADVTDLEAARKRYVQMHSAKEGSPKITMTVLAMKAVVTTLKAFPRFNSSYDAATGEVVLKRYYHIGVAVDTENGLMVPVIRNVDSKSVLQLAAEIGDLAQRARERKLTLADMQGGAFTITNLGGIGGTYFTPIVNYPEVAILGMSRTSQQMVVIDGKPEVRLMLPLSLSYDHRVINGADAARFIVKLSGLLSDPFQLLSEV
jgi:pyruvate dehydrogenase E2 component (dihydrolipoamide acetyltransferase)